MYKIQMAVTVFILFSACSERYTSWEYNNPQNGGFQKVPFYEQECPAGMILVKNKSAHKKTQPKIDCVSDTKI